MARHLSSLVFDMLVVVVVRLALLRGIDQVGLASLHASRNRAAADLMASESTRVEDGMLVMDEEVLQLALSRYLVASCLV